MKMVEWTNESSPTGLDVKGSSMEWRIATFTAAHVQKFMIMFLHCTTSGRTPYKVNWQFCENFRFTTMFTVIGQK